uniref:Aminotransferase-like plant mobile domain-containing protein n=1 Tax=Fagus sylvatica TaxID=28930 RepID=A0A2N9E278_FAGSY
MASIEVAPRIRHQCSVTKLMEVNNSLAEECKSQLQTTPFGWLLNLHCNIEASGRILEVMATRWNADARAFQVGDRLIPFTLYDIALILGLPVRGEPIDLEPISFWGAVYDFLVSGLSRAASSMQAKKGRGNLHIQGCTALLQIWACEHLGVGSKNAEINQPFPRFLAWTHQRMYTKKASEAFSKSANVLSVLVAMPWEQDFNVVEEAMETLQETHGSSHPIISRDDGAGPSSIPQTPSNELQLELQAERAEREALARQVRRLKDELDHVKGLVAAVLENSPNIQQNQAATLTKPAPTLTLTPNPHQTSPNPHQTSPNPHQTSPHPHPHKTSPHPHQTSPHPHPHKASPHPYPHTASPHPHKASCPFKAPIVDLPSSPSKAAKRGKAAKKKAKVAVVDLASSPSKQDNAGEAAAAMVDLVSSPSKGATSVTPNEVDSNEMAISTDTYDLTGREVSSLLADQAQDDGSRWISTAVVDAFKDVLMRKLTQTGHPPPYINFVISVHGGTTILGMAPSTSTQRGKRTRKGKQPIQDDQPQPEAVFRPSWVRSMPTNCNRYYIPLILLFAACIIEKSFGADMHGELEAYGCPYMAPTIQG